MREEVKIYFELNHPTICQFYEVFEDENSIYQLLQLCVNGDFMRFLKKKGRLSEFETRFYMNQIIDCLLYLNRESIIHRGVLSISNLLLDNEGHLVSEVTSNYYGILLSNLLLILNSLWRIWDWNGELMVCRITNCRVMSCLLVWLCTRCWRVNRCTGLEEVNMRGSNLWCHLESQIMLWISL